MDWQHADMFKVVREKRKEKNERKKKIDLFLKWGRVPDTC